MVRAMQNRAVICTHHKSGTVWMKQTFTAVAEVLGVSCVSVSRRGPDGPLPRGASFVRDEHSLWFVDGFYEPGDRVLHVIRDPRDVVISSMHYHQRSDEKWLHRPDDRFGGRTYQQAINSLPDDKARMIFEMDHSSRETIEGMCTWPYGRPDCFETKYETLLRSGRDEFATAVNHLGLTGREISVAVSAFLNASIADGARHRIGSNVHIRSGAPHQWRTAYDDDLARAFMDRFPNAISKLGYEPFEPPVLHGCCVQK